MNLSNKNKIPGGHVYKKNLMMTPTSKKKEEKKQATHV
jgi:hypothetical protein